MILLEGLIGDTNQNVYYSHRTDIYDKTILMISSVRVLYGLRTMLVLVWYV